MDAPITRQGFGLLLPANHRAAVTEAELLRLQAAQARDSAIAGGLRRAVGAVVGWVRALITLPRRAAVFEELNRLSDRELADIGLTRDGIARVFDEDFAIEREAERLRQARVVAIANSNEPSASAARAA
jgi:uncharacterized protein YjiS (DUF1127 family)